MNDAINVERDELRSHFSRAVYDRLFGNCKEENGEGEKEGSKEERIPKLRIMRAENRSKKDESINIPANKQPTLTDLLDFYKHQGLVGEEATCILQTFGAVHQLCFGIESLSGSGKTFVVDFLLDLLPEKYVYVAQQNSDKAAMYDADAINKARVVVFTELQKSSSKTMIEILKDLGEGKSAKRRVTNPDRTGVTEQVIEGGKGVIYTLATENWFKKDRELERRYFQLSTDISEEQTKRILQRQAQLSYLSHERLSLMTEQDITSLKAYIASCFELGEVKYINPFSESLIENLPLTVKARSFVKHFLNLVNACTHFHYRGRMRDGVNIFANLEDAYVIQQLYGPQAVRSSLRIPAHGEEVIGIFDEKVHSAEEVHRKLKRQKSPLTFPVTTDVLEELTEAGYLEKQNYSSRDSGYRKISEITGINKEIDWADCWERGTNIMHENYPEVFPKWSNLQLKNKEVSVFDPIRKEEVLIAEYENEPD